MQIPLPQVPGNSQLPIAFEASITNTVLFKQQKRVDRNTITTKIIQASYGAVTVCECS